MDGWTDEWMEGWTDVQTDRHLDRRERIFKDTKIQIFVAFRQTNPPTYIHIK